MISTALDQFDGDAVFDAECAEARARWEKLYEVAQMKGDGETHPLLSPEVELSDFETWDYGNLDATEAKTPAMLPAEYAREGSKRGLDEDFLMRARARGFSLAVRVARVGKSLRVEAAGSGQCLWGKSAVG